MYAVVVVAVAAVVVIKEIPKISHNHSVLVL